MQLQSGEYKLIKRKGIIVSTKGLKTCIIAVIRRIFHKKYGKVLSKTKRYTVHDEKENSKVGENVYFYSTKPISKRKHWLLSKRSCFTSHTSLNINKSILDEDRPFILSEFHHKRLSPLMKVHY